MLPVALEDVKVTDPPEQNDNGPLAEIVGVEGARLTLTVLGIEVELQVFPSVTVTE